MRIHVCIYIYVCLYTCIYVYVHIYIYRHCLFIMCSFIYVFNCLLMYLCVYICIYTYYLSVCVDVGACVRAIALVSFLCCSSTYICLTITRVYVFNVFVRFVCIHCNMWCAGTQVWTLTCMHECLSGFRGACLVRKPLTDASTYTY